MLFLKNGMVSFYQHAVGILNQFHITCNSTNATHNENKLLHKQNALLDNKK